LKKNSNEGSFGRHHRKALRASINYKLRDSIEIEIDTLYHVRSMPSLSDPWVG
jgi:hypothetical protein